MARQPALVLVVDDDEMVRDGVSQCLTDDGYEVRVASNGRDAFDEIAAVRPDLILVDWMMPVMSGEQFLAALRADTALAKVPVIVMTASPTGERAGGDTTFLQKPVRMKALLEAVGARLRSPA